jgi:signal peptidase I
VSIDHDPKNNQQESANSRAEHSTSGDSGAYFGKFEYNDTDKETVVKEKRSGLKDFLDLVTSMLIIFIAGLAIREFVLKPFTVNGKSMEPTLHTNDYLFIDQFSYRFGDPNRGDIVVFIPPVNATQEREDDKPYIKRVIATPGESIEINSKGEVLVFSPEGKVYRVNEEYTQGTSDIIYPKRELEDDEYFVMGDNRLHGASFDSRRFHAIEKEDIIGKAFFRLYPFEDAGFFDDKPILVEVKN